MSGKTPWEDRPNRHAYCDGEIRRLTAERDAARTAIANSDVIAEYERLGGVIAEHERLRAELNRVTAERDELSARLADAVSPAARDYDNAAEILRLRDERDGLRATLRAIQAGNAAAVLAEPDAPGDLRIMGAGTEHLVAELAEEGR